MIPRNLTAMVQMGSVTTGGGPPESLDSSSQQFPWAHLALVGWPFALTSLAVIGRSIKGAILRWDRMARWENVMRQDILFVSRNANKIWIFKKKNKYEGQTIMLEGWTHRHTEFPLAFLVTEFNKSKTFDLPAGLIWDTWLPPSFWNFTFRQLFQFHSVPGTMLWLQTVLEDPGKGVSNML